MAEKFLITVLGGLTVWFIVQKLNDLKSGGDGVDGVLASVAEDEAASDILV